MLFGQLVEHEVGIVLSGRIYVRKSRIGKVFVHRQSLLDVLYIPFVRSVFARLRIAQAPVHVHLRGKQVGTGEHVGLHALVFEAPRPVASVVDAALRFPHDGSLVAGYRTAVIYRFYILELRAVTSLAVVAPVVHEVGRNGVAGIDFPVYIEGGAAPDALHVVFADIHLLDIHVSPVVLRPHGFYVVRTVILVHIGGAEHHAESVVEEAVAVHERTRTRRSRADGIVAAQQGQRNALTARSRAGDEVYRTADCIGIHIGRQRLVDLYRLYHVRWNDVHLHLPVVAFGRRDAVSVQRHRVEFGGEPPHDDIARLALVVLHGDARNPLQRVSYVGIGETAYLVGRNDVRYIDIRFLLVQRLGLSARLVAHDHDGPYLLRPFLHHEIDHGIPSGRHRRFQYGRLVPQVLHLHPVGTRRHVQKFKIPVVIRHRITVEPVQFQDGTRQGHARSVLHGARYKPAFLREYPYRKQQNK